MACQDAHMSRNSKSPFRRSTPIAPRVAIVTGGASGIGRALCAALIGRGASVVLADIDEAAAQRTAAELGPLAKAAAVDVTDRSAMIALVGRVVEEHGHLDLFVNNAGIGIGGPAESMTERHWKKVIELNLGGVVNGVDAAYPVMLHQGFGTILNTASLAGLVPSPEMVPYAATKHAVVGLSLALRVEAAAHGIRVSALCPGFVDTPLLDTLYEPPAGFGDTRERVRTFQPRLLDADKVAQRALRGLDRNQPLIVVGAFGHLIWRATRLSPALATSVAAHLAAREKSK